MAAYSIWKPMNPNIFFWCFWFYLIEPFFCPWFIHLYDLHWLWVVAWILARTKWLYPLIVQLSSVKCSEHLLSCMSTHALMFPTGLTKSYLVGCCFRLIKSPVLLASPAYQRIVATYKFILDRLMSVDNSNPGFTNSFFCYVFAFACSMHMLMVPNRFVANLHEHPGTPTSSTFTDSETTIVVSKWWKSHLQNSSWNILLLGGYWIYGTLQLSQYLVRRIIPVGPFEMNLDESNLRARI